MSEKQLSANSNQGILNHLRKALLLHAVFLDVLGIILVLVGSLYTHYHGGSIAGGDCILGRYYHANCGSDNICVE